MSVPLEHDYIIGLSEAPPPPSMERTSEKKKFSPSSSTEEKTNNNTTSLNLKATELRLGLPGSHYPERKPPQAHATNVSSGVLLFGPSKSFVSSGAKRGFSDAIDGKWVFSEVDLGKGGVLFSPRSNNGNTQKAGVVVPQMKKEGGGGINVSQSAKTLQEKSKQVSAVNENASAPAAKAQVVGWPPIRSYRKNTMASKLAKNNEDAEGKSGYGYLYVKVSMEGAPYLRKVDLKTYSNYMELSSALETMFSCFTIGKCGSQELSGRDGLNETSLKDLLRDSEYVLTYEDKDGDWMLVGDVPWEMFTDSCRRLKIMKGSEAIGLAPRAMEKCKNHYISLPDKKFLKEVFA